MPLIIAALFSLLGCSFVFVLWRLFTARRIITRLRNSIVFDENLAELYRQRGLSFTSAFEAAVPNTKAHIESTHQLVAARGQWHARVSEEQAAQSSIENALPIFIGFPCVFIGGPADGFSILLPKSTDTIALGGVWHCLTDGPKAFYRDTGEMNEHGQWVFKHDPSEVEEGTFERVA